MGRERRVFRLSCGGVLLVAGLWGAAARGDEPGVLEKVGKTLLEKLVPDVREEAEAVVVEDAQFRQFEDQFTGVLKRMAAGELLFAQKVLEPDAKQKAHLRKAGLAEVKKVAQKMARLQARNALQGSSVPDVRALFAATLRRAAAEVFPADAMKQYDAELAERQAARKEAALGQMMALIDRRVMLTSAQYGELAEAIGKNWNAQWERNPSAFLYAEYAPMPASRVMLPHLTPLQKESWNARPNNGTISFGWQGDIGAFGGNDGVFLDELEEEVQAEEPKGEPAANDAAAKPAEAAIEAEAPAKAAIEEETP